MYLNAAGPRGGTNLLLQTKRNPINNSDLISPLEAKSGRRFRRYEHLKRRATITGVLKNGRAVRCIGSKLFFLANELPCNRIAITMVRKYGNAVKRNRARRLGREAYRLMKNELKTGYDLVLLIFPRSESAPSKRGTLEETAGQLKMLFKKAGLIRSEET